MAADEHREHQVAVAFIGGVGHAVLEGARPLQHKRGRALQALGRRELERDPRAVSHLGDVAAVISVLLEPDPLRLVSIGARVGVLHYLGLRQKVKASGQGSVALGC